MTKFVIVLCCFSAFCCLQISAAPFFLNFEKTISSSYRVPENDTPERAVQSISQVPVFGNDWLSKLLAFCKIFGVNVYNSPVTTTTRRPKTTTTVKTTTTELPSFVPSDDDDSSEKAEKNIDEIFGNTDTDSDKDNEIAKEDKTEKPKLNTYLPVSKSSDSNDEEKVELANSPTTKRPGEPSPNDGPPGEGPAPDKIALPEEEIVELSDEEFAKLQAKLKANEKSTDDPKGAARLRKK